MSDNMTTPIMQEASLYATTRTRPGAPSFSTVFLNEPMLTAGNLLPFLFDLENLWESSLGKCNSCYSVDNVADYERAYHAIRNEYDRILCPDQISRPPPSLFADQWDNQQKAIRSEFADLCCVSKRFRTVLLYADEMARFQRLAQILPCLDNYRKSPESRVFRFNRLGDMTDNCGAPLDMNIQWSTATSARYRLRYGTSEGDAVAKATTFRRLPAGHLYEQGSGLAQGLPGYLDPHRAPATIRLDDSQWWSMADTSFLPRSCVSFVANLSGENRNREGEHTIANKFVATPSVLTVAKIEKSTPNDDRSKTIHETGIASFVAVSAGAGSEAEQSVFYEARYPRNRTARGSGSDVRGLWSRRGLPIDDRSASKCPDLQWEVGDRICIHRAELEGADCKITAFLQDLLKLRPRSFEEFCSLLEE